MLSAQLGFDPLTVDFPRLERHLRLQLKQFEGRGYRPLPSRTTLRQLDLAIQRF